MTPKISVIVPSYNSRLTIEHTLRGLHQQDNLSRVAEIIVVDSSDDGETPGFLAGYRSEKLRIIHAGQKVMPAVGRNIGSEAAAGDVLVFIDADAYPENDFIARIVEAFESGCRVGGGSVSLPDFQERCRIAWAQFFLQFNEYMDAGDRRIKCFVPSCNLFCERELFHQAGGFPNMRAAEDVVFGLKARRISPLWFVPGIRIRHIFREDRKAFLRNQILLGQYVMIYRRREFSDKIYYKGILPMLFLPAFVGIKFLRISSRVFRSRVAFIGKYVWSSPLFFLGLVFWAYGFAQGVFENDGV